MDNTNTVNIEDPIDVKTQQMVEVCEFCEKWIDINERQPEDGERVLTWNNRFNEVRIQVFNKEYECWDTDDGDDFEFSLDEGVIQYWQPLPEKPELLNK